MVLGIESTCDETAAAVVAEGVDVRSNVVATQVELHAKYRGVVPEIASRAHIENILPVLTEAMRQAGFAANDFSGIDAVAVAHRPGLIGSLLVGVTAAKTLAWALGKPLIGVDHVHAHLYSVVLQTNSAPSTERKGDKPHYLAPPMPAVGLVCSGGHTAIYRVGGWLDVELIGATIDDAVGEAYDKVAALLGLGYPGGPILDRLAAEGNPKAVRFPRTLLGRDSLDFSFSGLKTAVLYHVRGVPRRGQDVKSEPAPVLSQAQLADVAASFQAACIDVITEKLKRAVRRMGARSVIVGGGVSANAGLRAALSRFPVPVFFPPMRYCTDNAAMSAGLADVYLRAGRTNALDLDAITYSQFARTKVAGNP
ncbi:MAG TPA: tRNA (adenosine(37)-N6)-threonylcarbamoyltransferase complex transferase subunit TsaD [Tepidisphaeraceae bacterium]|jgi:N6-L-threonylcarbamoyladenine synthase|nr:tRNA (adenosine(37)-N6)-threonylcarbamoyltransferase complex transferase subunit TsaD [Tepidisphaeraceae bacterium]